MKFGRECACGRGGECQGISAAFALLKDPRKGYVLLPKLTPEPTCYQEVDMNAMRASYLRHLRRTEQSLGDSQVNRYVALHHFHPIVVMKHSEMSDAVSPIPKTVRKVDLQFLKMDLGDEDRVRDEHGRKRKQYYFVPNWPIQSAKEDLKHLIRASRIYQEAKIVSPATPKPISDLAVVVPEGSIPNGPSPAGTPIAPRNLSVPLAEAAVSTTPLKHEAVDVTAQVTPTKEEDIDQKVAAIATLKTESTTDMTAPPIVLAKATAPVVTMSIPSIQLKGDSIDAAPAKGLLVADCTGSTVNKPDDIIPSPSEDSLTKTGVVVAPISVSSEVLARTTSSGKTEFKGIDVVDNQAVRSAAEETAQNEETPSPSVEVPRMAGVVTAPFAVDPTVVAIAITSNETGLNIDPADGEAVGSTTDKTSFNEGTPSSSVEVPSVTGGVVPPVSFGSTILAGTATSDQAELKDIGAVDSEAEESPAAKETASEEIPSPSAEVHSMTGGVTAPVAVFSSTVAMFVTSNETASKDTGAVDIEPVGSRADKTTPNEGITSSSLKGDVIAPLAIASTVVSKSMTSNETELNDIDAVDSQAVSSTAEKTSTSEGLSPPSVQVPSMTVGEVAPIAAGSTVVAMSIISNETVLKDIDAVESMAVGSTADKSGTTEEIPSRSVEVPRISGDEVAPVPVGSALGVMSITSRESELNDIEATPQETIVNEDQDVRQSGSASLDSNQAPVAAAMLPVSSIVEHEDYTVDQAVAVSGPSPETAGHHLSDAPVPRDVEDFVDVELSATKSDDDESAPFILPSVPITNRIFDTEYDGEKLPRHLSMESEEGRKFLFRRMENFEAKRVEVIAPLVDEFVVRWTASLQVLQAGIFEMARAERLIRGAALANKAYAEAMQANFEDGYLDAEGNAITDKRTQNRFSRERESLDHSVDSSLMSPEKMKEAQAKNAAFRSIVESQQVISGKFTENYESVNENVVSELENLRNHLKEELIEFKRRGDPLIRDIQGSESEVQIAFTVLDILGPCPEFSGVSSSSQHAKRSRFRVSFTGGTPLPAAGSYHGSPAAHSSHASPISRSNHESPGSVTSPASPMEHSRSFFGRRQVGLRAVRGGSSHGSSSHEGMLTMSPTQEQYSPVLALNPALLSHASSPIASIVRNGGIMRDGWLIEMLYRQAVNAQVLILQRCGAALEEIWQSMHQIEVTRRIRLHEVMLDFMPRQRRLFLGLSPISGTILNDLVEQRKDQQQLEEQLEDEIRKQMEALLKIDNSKRSHIMNRSRASAPNFEEVHGTLTGEFFDNGLLRAAKVVERKTGVLGNWKTTLAVVTGGNYLHLFDVSFIPEVVIGSPAESVFELLLPDFEITSFSTDVVYKREELLLKNLTPQDTIDLSKCSSSVSDDARTMDIIESVKGIIGFDATRKFTLRVISSKENEEWLSVLQECHLSGGSASTPQNASTNQQLLDEELQVLRAVQNVEAKLARV